MEAFAFSGRRVIRDGRDISMNSRVRTSRIHTFATAARFTRVSWYREFTPGVTSSKRAARERYIYI